MVNVSAMPVIGTARRSCTVRPIVPDDPAFSVGPERFPSR